MPDVRIEPNAQIDLITPTGPATSATTDVPVVETKPDVQVTKAAPDKAEKTESAPVETTEDTTASDEPGKKPAKGVQKRIDELTGNWREEQRARLASDAKLERALGLLEKALSGKPAEAASDEAEPAEPDVGKYSDQNAYNADYRKYLKDMATYAGRQAARETTKRDTEEARKRGQEEGRRKATETYRERVAKAKEKYADYEAVTTADNVPITQYMADAIVESEHGTDVAYYLGTNVSEAERIARLSPRGQLMELGYLTAQFRQAAKEEVKPQVTQAPKPIKPLATGSRSAAVTSSGEPDMDSYAAKRRPQLQAERGPGGRR